MRRVFEKGNWHLAVSNQQSALSQKQTLPLINADDTDQKKQKPLKHGGNGGDRNEQDLPQIDADERGSGKAKKSEPQRTRRNTEEIGK